MNDVPVFALPNPWAFHDWNGPQELRRQRLGASAVRIPSGGPLFLAAPEGSRLIAGGRRRGVQPETGVFKHFEGSYTLSSVSIGTRPEEKRLLVSGNGAMLGEIELDGYVPRAGWTAGRHGGAPTSFRAEALDRFIELTIERIRAAEGVSLGRPVWERLAEAWMSDQWLIREPPISLIVRHARRMRLIIADIASRPRRLLQRHHELIRVGQVQQLDASCVRWLSRQPGRNVFERAGPRQRILAVTREETIDTLENRVLRDFSERSGDVARRYLMRYERLSASMRWRLVEGYAEECARIARELGARAVSRAKPPVVPNYALLQERRYRSLWRAYRELLKNIDDQDELWRWQHRLWADFCRLAVHVALRQAAGAHGVVAELPLRIAGEQQRGRWSLIGGQSGVFVLERRGRNFVFSLVADLAERHPMVSPWMFSLGASAALHVQALDNGREARLVIWAIHEAGEQVASLAELARSAERAMSDCLRDWERYYDEKETAGGLVIASVVDRRDKPDGPPIHRHGGVCALGLGPEFPLLSTGLHWTAETILALANDLTR